MGLIARLKSWVDLEILTHTDLNAEFDNILNNLDPDGMEDISANQTAMDLTSDPHPGGTPSLATDLRGELLRLRFMLVQITGEAKWYIDPDVSLATILADYVTRVGAQTLEDKTLTTPTIASFVNANHDHSVSSKGGTLFTFNSAENGGVVTLLSSATVVASVSLGTVTAGDIILLEGYFFATKGGTGGPTVIGVGKTAGAATLEFMHDLPQQVVNSQECDAGSGYYHKISAVAKVTVGGTLTAYCYGYSTGSDSSISTGAGQFFALFLRKQ